MPRNSSGTYTLPSGNPVVTGTVVSSTWSNTTLGDIATEMTNSLDRNGRGPMLAPLPLSNGSAGAPALTFASEPSSGLFRNAAGDLEFSVAGTSVQTWLVTGAQFTRGVVATQSQTNLSSVTGTGNGTGAGLSGTGGSSSGPGVSGAGGGTSGSGGAFTGAATAGPGVVGTGGGTATGVTGFSGSAGGGAGVDGRGGAGTNDFGGRFFGSGNGGGVQGIPGGTSIIAVRADGIITLASAPALASAPNAAPGDKLLSYASVVRAWVDFTGTGANGAQTVSNSFNVSGVSRTGTSFTVTFNGVVFSGATYIVSHTYSGLSVGTFTVCVTNRTATACTMQLVDNSNVPISVGTLNSLHLAFIGY